MESGISKDKIKVLWFCNTPSLAESYLNNKPMGGGWIKSLEKEIQAEVDLSIVFYCSKNVKPFRYGETDYYPVHRKSNKWSKLKNVVFNLLEPEEDILVFLDIIERVKPDIIHVHGTEQNFGLIQKYIKIPTLISIQGNISVYTYKFFSGISYLRVLKNSSLSKIFSFRSALHSYKRYLKASYREKEIFKISKNFIGRTAWDRRIAKVLAPSSQYFHNDEILRDSFYRYVWSNKWDKESTFQIFTTNGPNLYKGIETILYAASLLDNNKIKFNWKIAGISKGDEIVKLACNGDKEIISKNIEFLGKIDETQLVEQLLNSHLYIMPSHIENSPNNLCEAQLLGMPCIATTAGGTSSLVEDNIDGFLIQDGDPYVMAGSIMEVMNDYEEALLLAKRAREKALLRHDKIKIKNELLEIYKTIQSA